MSDDSSDLPAQIPASVLRSIDQACDDFAHAWNAGLQPDLREFLNRIPALGLTRGFCELVGLEIDLRRRTGEAIEIGEYLQRFPAQTALIEKLLEQELPTTGVSTGSRDPQETSTTLPQPAPGLPARIGKFTVLDKLGSGTYGIVYLAYEVDVEQKVALKVPQQEHFKTAAQQDAFLHDARLAINLEHPGVVTIYEIDSSGKLPVIVQEYMPGGDLKARLQAGPIPVRTVVAWMIDVAETVACAHQKGILHRDLKPANILLDARGKPRVADFGLALREQDQPRHRDEFAGTLPYMSPEQVRRESNRLDGRSDTWSLGVILYEMLTYRRPFSGSKDDIEDHIKHRPPRPLRERRPELPEELERICLKCLERRVAGRYASAQYLADDLRKWLEQDGKPPQPQARQQHPLEPIVPKGLRSFDKDDASFFLQLLPGPRDRDGIPDCVRFWKNLIEETDPDRTFAVGVLHGPSGCGKSSLVKAGIVPQLAAPVTTVFVEATAEDTEVRLLNRLRRLYPEIPANVPLPDVLAGLRDRTWRATGDKLLLVFDQFEQWLHAGNVQAPSQLVDALRHCDGEHLQCLILVREDFWSGISRFMQQLEIPLQEQTNSMLVDRFDRFHARHVLEKFGRSFLRLPATPLPLTALQEQFLEQAIDYVSEKDGVNCARLALFSELFRTREFTLKSLKSIQARSGLEVTFLEETFAAKSAPASYRQHLAAVQTLFAELLPGTETEIKGGMRSRAYLQQKCGYNDDQFRNLISILDEKLRLITATDPEGLPDPEPGGSRAGDAAPRFYQLAHDYLVPSVRAWLKLYEPDDPRARAHRLLADRTSLYVARPEDRHLPSFGEHVRIRVVTDARHWTPAERRMLKRAARIHGRRTLFSLLFLTAALWGAYEVNGSLSAGRLVDQTMAKDVPELERQLESLMPYRHWVVPGLQRILDSDGPPADRLKAALVLSKLTDTDQAGIDRLFQQLLDASPVDAVAISRFLRPWQSSLTERLWQVIAAPRERRHRLRAAAALALLAPDDRARWDEWSRDIAGELVSAPTTETWSASLRPVGRFLVPELETVYRDRRPDRTTERALAAAALADYLSADPDQLINLALLAGNDREFLAFMEPLRAYRERVRTPLEAILDEEIPANPNSSVRDRAWARQANAAVCLVQLGVGDRVWRRLRHSNNPSLASLLVQKFQQLATPLRVLAERLASEPDVTARQALILCVGEYDPLAIPAQERNALLASLTHLHREHPDSGIHGSAEWTLRRWGSLGPASKQDSASDAQADAANSAADPATTALDRGSTWYVNNQGQELLVIRGPDEVLMNDPVATGVPPDVARISHTFAIGFKEVTVAEYERLCPEKSDGREPDRRQNMPIQSISWYDAIKYCNRLNESERIARQEWCYAPNAEGKYADGMQIPPDWQRRTGYRLPTQAEWACACRAHTVSPYTFGEPVDLLSRYAWYVANSRLGNGQIAQFPVGQLRPNVLGAFDMNGNVWEWCHDDTAAPDNSTVTASRRCVARGGSVQDNPFQLRPVYSVFSTHPADENTVIGFRVARTLPAPGVVPLSRDQSRPR